jgi:DegV family protein with EDD domain
MNKVAIVTDSTAYIPPALRDQNHIHVASTWLHWGSQNFRDGVDIQSAEFFERLKTDPVHPSTAAMSPGEMKAVYEAALATSEAIVSIHLSSKLSAVHQAALDAQAMLPDKSITIINSPTTSMALGFIVLEAAKAAQSGRSAEDVAKAAQAAFAHVGVFLTPETLTYLQRGGRIGPARAFLGNLLDSKPLLEVADGEVKPVERVRSRKKAISRLVEMVVERLNGKSNVRLAAIHAAALPEATDVLEAARSKLGGAVTEAFVVDVSPTVAVHTGPGTVGLAYCEGL